MHNDLSSLLRAALECSIYVKPLQPGLFATELFEIAQAAGYQPGEINDAIPSVGQSFIGGGGFITPDPGMRQSFLFLHPEEPEHRNFRAFDLVIAELVQEEKAVGVQRAQLDRSVIVARALAAGFTENEVQIAITLQVMSGVLVEKDGVIQFQ